MKLIKVSAMWCPGCLILNKIMKSIKEEHPDLEIIEYDYDFDNEEIKYLNVGQVLPVLVFTDDNGIEKRRLVGEKTKEEIEEVLRAVNK